MAFIRGTSIGDNLSGTPENDEILGLAGNDTLSGTAGHDTLYGGPGNDILIGRDGDLIDGGTGSDHFFIGADFRQPVLTARGGRDNDTFESISLFDPTQPTFNFGLDLDGGSGDDTFNFASVQASVMDGGRGNDTFTIDRIFSGTFNGGSGQDHFEIRFMLGHVAAGDGNDVIVLGGAESGGSGGGVTLRGEDGNDVISSGVGSCVIEGGAGNDRLSDGFDQNDRPSRLDGGTGNDMLSSQGGDNLLGGSGRDTLESSAHANVLTGGADGDRFVYGNLVFLGSSDPSIQADTITDFGTGRDILDLSRLLERVGAPDNPFTSGFLDLDVQDGSTSVRFDRDGGGDNFVVLVTLQNFILAGNSASLIL